MNPEALLKQVIKYRKKNTCNRGHLETIGQLMYHASTMKGTNELYETRYTADGVCAFCQTHTAAGTMYRWKSLYVDRPHICHRCTTAVLHGWAAGYRSAVATLAGRLVAFAGAGLGDVNLIIASHTIAVTYFPIVKK